MIARLLRRAADLADLIGWVLDQAADVLVPREEVNGG